MSIDEGTPPVRLPPDAEVPVAYAELARIDLAATDLPGVLQRVCELAMAAIPGAAAASMTLLSDRAAGAAVFSDDRAAALDERQHDPGYGPCLEAAAHQRVIVVTDTATEVRWPSFVRDARRHGVAACLCIGIPVREAVTGALSLYGLEAGVFDEAAVERAVGFQDYAAVALANAHLYDATATLAAQMTEAMASRAVIEQAKGVLIAQRTVSSDEAFEMLAQASQVANRKVRDIAQAIVEKAQRPR